MARRWSKSARAQRATMGQACPSQQNPARRRAPVPRRVVAVPYRTERAVGKAEGEHPWGDKGRTVVAGLEKPLLEEGRHPGPPAATQGTGRETGPGCQRFGRAPWAQHELGQVGGCRHPCCCWGPPRGAQDPAGAVAFSRPPGSGKTGKKREACFAGEFFFCLAHFMAVPAMGGTTGNGPGGSFCSAQPFPEPFQPGPPCPQV